MKTILMVILRDAMELWQTGRAVAHYNSNHFKCFDLRVRCGIIKARKTSTVHVLRAVG